MLSYGWYLDHVFQAPADPGRRLTVERHLDRLGEHMAATADQPDAPVDAQEQRRPTVPNDLADSADATSVGGMMHPVGERIDRRYSDEGSEAVAWGQAEARLTAAQVSWVVTVRPDGSPHATPVVAVVHEGKVYFHTGSAEVKYANLQANPHVLVLSGDTAWESGLDVAVEGTAVAVSDDALLKRLAGRYRDRWDGRWNLDIHDGAVVSQTPGVHLVVFEVRPGKAYAYAKGGPFSQTTYRF